MKKTSVFKYFSAVAICSVLLFSSCDVPEYSAETVTAGSNTGKSFTDYNSYSITPIDSSKVGSDFMRGVDVSEVEALEELGQKWYDSDNTEKDVFKILANHGVNWVRIRIWNDYTVALNDSWGPYGYNNLKRTIAMAKRAKAAGQKIFLDFHYSDNWADPGKQYIPEAWKDYVESNGTALESSAIDITGLSKAVADYTSEVLNAMKAENCLPEMVQLGNEMQGGIFTRTRTNATSATGSDGIETTLTFDQQYTILKAAKKAVKDIDDSILVALHCTNNRNTLNSFINGFVTNVDPDVVAISYYPYYSSHGLDSELAGFMDKIVAKGKKAIIAEISYSYDINAYTDNTNNQFYTTQETNSAASLSGYSGVKDNKIVGSIENQAGVLKYVAEKAGTNCSGIFYWGGCYLGIEPKTGLKMSSAWENQALFDVNGKILPSVDVFAMK